MRLAITRCDSSAPTLCHGSDGVRSELHRSVLAARSETDATCHVPSVRKRGRFVAESLRDRRLEPFDIETDERRTIHTDS